MIMQNLTLKFWHSGWPWIYLGRDWRSWSKVKVKHITCVFQATVRKGSEVKVKGQGQQLHFVLRGTEFMGGVHPNPPEFFLQQIHGNLSWNLKFFGFWAVSLLKRAPRRQGVMVTWKKQNLLGALLRREMARFLKYWKSHDKFVWKRKQAVEFPQAGGKLDASNF